jgi:serine/threonine protein kinase
MSQREKEQIGRYEILEEIGRGAMGAVFKGRDPLIGRAVAVKTITSGVAQSADLLERFYREARAAGGLQHPNIVTIYELAESGGAPFIAMEYLEGESLEKIIARKPVLPLATKLGYIVQTCRALDYAHLRGVIHRDVKPANIVVTRDGIVKVVDFGIARLGPTSNTQTGMLLGTLAYMSPELVRGQHADARSDIWAMGVLLYELITYQRPFTGENHAALLLSILQNEPPPLRQAVPECPVGVERIISKCLRKDEKERYPSMEALLRDVENLNPFLTGASSRGEGSKGMAQAPAAKTSVQPSPTLLLASNPIIPGVHPAGVAPDAPLGTSQFAKTVPPANIIPKEPARPASHLLRNAAATCALLTAIVLGAIGVARRDTALGIARRYNALGVVQRYKILALDIRPDSAQNVNLTAPAPGPSPLPDASPEASTPVAAVQTLTPTELGAPGTPTADVAMPAAASGPVLKPGSPLPDSIEDASRQEQTLWEKAMAYLQAGDLEDAETWFRNILTLPEVGRHWSDAAHYVDQVIPERRQDEKLWAAAQLASISKEAGHLLQEVKALDQLLTFPGPHRKAARQMRDTAITELIRDDARRNQMDTPVVSDADQWQLTRFKNHFDELVEEGDAAALNELEDLLPKFKSLADAQGPLAIDARDYLNSVIPKAQQHIEDRLAATKSNSSANAAYTSAVRAYSRALATQNSAMLQDRVLPLFSQIAQSGSARAKEAQRYADVLIPAALQKSRP